MEIYQGIQNGDGNTKFSTRQNSKLCNPDKSQFLKDSEKIVMPHFEKMLNKSGLLGWGVATKITPQGKNSQGGDYATAMTYDYDNLKNVINGWNNQFMRKC